MAVDVARRGAGGEVADVEAVVDDIANAALRRAERVHAPESPSVVAWPSDSGATWGSPILFSERFEEWLKARRRRGPISDEWVERVRARTEAAETKREEEKDRMRKLKMIDAPDPPKEEGGGEPDPPGDDDLVGSGKECCVERFDYPRTWGKKDTEDGCAKEIRFQFTFGAEYLDKVRNCDCRCCEFQQYVLTYHYQRFMGIGPKFNEDSSEGKFKEDCVYVEPGSSHRRPFPTGAAPRAGDQKGCYPAQFDPTTRNRAGEDSHVRRENEDGSLSCTWWDWDSPVFEAGCMAYYYVGYRFLGVIRDRCNPPRIADIALFNVVQQGIVTETGSVINEQTSALETTVDGDAMPYARGSSPPRFGR